MDDEAFALDTAPHFQELRVITVRRFLAKTLGQTTMLMMPGLVLQRDEDDALGGARLLAHQHQACDPHVAPF